MIDPSQISVRVKQLRQNDARKLRRADVAKILKVSVESVRLYESGKSLTLQMISQLANLYGVSEKYLIFGSPDETEATEQTKTSDDTLLTNFSWLNDVDKKRIGSEVAMLAKANRALLARIVKERRS